MDFEEIRNGNMRFIGAAILLLAIVGRIDAAVLTINFVGTVGTSSPLPPISSGTPFAGTATIDTLAPGQAVPGFNLYSQVEPPAHFSLQLAGLTLQSTGGGAVRIGTSNPTLNKLEMPFPLDSLAGQGWSYTPSPNATKQIVGSLDTTYPIGLPTELAQLDLVALLGSHPPFGHLRLQAGDYTFPGGSASIPDGSFPDVFLNITSFTFVPEPSSLALLGFLALGLAGYAWRAARKLSTR